MSDFPRDRFAPGSGPWEVSGVALAAGTVPGSDGDRRVTPGALEVFAPTLASDSKRNQYGTDGLVVVEHGESSRDVVGAVTASPFAGDRDTPAVKYEAEIDDPQIARGIDAGRFEVSPRLRYASDEMLTPDNVEDGALVIDSDTAGRMVHLSVEPGSRAPGSTAESGALDETEPADAEPAGTDMSPDATVSLFHGDNTRTTSRTTITDMNATNDSDDGAEAQNEKLADLRAKVEQAEQAGMQGMVDHYRQQIDDLKAGDDVGGGETETDMAPGATTAATPDAAAIDEPREYSEADLESAEFRGWGAAADAVRERQASAETATDADAAAGETSTTDMSPGEVAVEVNNLRNKRLTAIRMGEEEMVDHYEEKIASLMGHDVEDI